MPNLDAETFWFDVSGCKDTLQEIEDNPNSIPGCKLGEAVKSALLTNGWTEADTGSDVFAEDWGWCFFIKHEAETFMIGVHVTDSVEDADDNARYQAVERDEAGAFAEHWHKRGLMDVLTGRRKRDPSIQVAGQKAFHDVLSDMSQVRNLKAEADM